MSASPIPALRLPSSDRDFQSPRISTRQVLPNSLSSSISEPATGRPLSSCSFQGHLVDPASTDAANGEAELQVGLQRTTALLEQLTKVGTRLATTEHAKIFEGVKRANSNNRIKSTVGLVLENCVVVNVVTGGPAFNSREFSKGDKIVSVDGVRVDRSSIHTAVRGLDVVGSEVELGVVKTHDPSQVKLVKLSRADAEQIADRIQMMEIFARLKVQVQHDTSGNSAVEACALVDEMMFTYSRSLASLAETDRRVRANLEKLQSQERLGLAELLKGLDKVEILIRYV